MNNELVFNNYRKVYFNVLVFDNMEKFIIVSQARTGSTMLTSALSHHQEILMHGEVFGMDNAHLNFYGIDYKHNPPLVDILRSIRNKDPVKFFYDFVLQAGNRKAVGLKFKFEELSQPIWEPLVEVIKDDVNIKIIFLKRRNLWERYLSEYVAVNVTKIFNTQDPNYGRDTIEIEIPPLKVEKAFRRSRRWERLYYKMFKSHPHIRLTYEGLINNLEGRMQEVQNFLGVQSENLFPSTIKLNKGKMLYKVKNLEELKNHFFNTELTTFFNEDK